MSKKPTSNPLIKAVRKSAARFATKPSGISHAGKGLPMNKLVFTSMPSTGSTGTNLSSIAVTVKTPSGQTVNTTLLVTLSLSSGPGRFSTGVGAVARSGGDVHGTAIANQRHVSVDGQCSEHFVGCLWTPDDFHRGSHQSCTNGHLPVVVHRGGESSCGDGCGFVLHNGPGYFGHVHLLVGFRDGLNRQRFVHN